MENPLKTLQQLESCIEIGSKVANFCLNCSQKVNELGKRIRRPKGSPPPSKEETRSRFVEAEIVDCGIRLTENKEGAAEPFRASQHFRLKCTRCQRLVCQFAKGKILPKGHENTILSVVLRRKSLPQTNIPSPDSIAQSESPKKRKKSSESPDPVAKRTRKSKK